MKITQHVLQADDCLLEMNNCQFHFRVFFIGNKLLSLAFYGIFKNEMNNC